MIMSSMRMFRVPLGIFHGDRPASAMQLRSRCAENYRLFAILIDLDQTWCDGGCVLYMFHAQKLPRFTLRSTRPAGARARSAVGSRADAVRTRDPRGRWGLAGRI